MSYDAYCTCEVRILITLPARKKGPRYGKSSIAVTIEKRFFTDYSNPHWDYKISRILPAFDRVGALVKVRGRSFDYEVALQGRCNPSTMGFAIRQKGLVPSYYSSVR